MSTEPVGKTAAGRPPDPTVMLLVRRGAGEQRGPRTRRELEGALQGLRVVVPWLPADVTEALHVIWEVPAFPTRLGANPFVARLLGAPVDRATLEAGEHCKRWAGALSDQDRDTFQLVDDLTELKPSVLFVSHLDRLSLRTSLVSLVVGHQLVSGRSVATNDGSIETHPLSRFDAFAKNLEHHLQLNCCRAREESVQRRRRWRADA